MVQPCKLCCYSLRCTLLASHIFCGVVSVLEVVMCKVVIECLCVCVCGEEVVLKVCACVQGRDLLNGMAVID